MRHKAYLDFMKRWAEGLEKRFENIVHHSVDVFKKDDPTQQDVEDVSKDFRNLGKDVGSDAVNTAQEEMEERIVHYRQVRGLTEERAESKFKGVFDLAEKARDAAPNVIGKTKTLWIKLIAAVSAGIAVLAASVSISSRSPVQPSSVQASPTHSRAPESFSTFDPKPDLAAFAEVSEFDRQAALVNFVTVSDVQLSNFVTSLAHPLVPLSDSVISELPAAVAKVKDEPVKVSISGHTYDQTVGSVYSSRDTPEPVRNAVKEHAEKEYQYATMTTHHLYEEKKFNLGSFDGKRGTDMGTINLKLGEKGK